MDGFISPGKYQIVAYDPAGHAGGCLSISRSRAGRRQPVTSLTGAEAIVPSPPTYPHPDLFRNVINGQGAGKPL